MEFVYRSTSEMDYTVLDDTLETGYTAYWPTAAVKNACYRLSSFFSRWMTSWTARRKFDSSWWKLWTENDVIFTALLCLLLTVEHRLWPVQDYQGTPLASLLYGSATICYIWIAILSQNPSFSIVSPALTGIWCYIRSPDYRRFILIENNIFLCKSKQYLEWSPRYGAKWSEPSCQHVCPALTGTLEVSVVVLDASDNAPTFDGGGRYEARVTENASPSTVVTRVSAHDVDTDRNARVVYGFAASTRASFGNVFAIDNVTGEIYVVGQVDFEAAPVFRLIFTAVNAGVDSKTEEVISQTISQTTCCCQN